MGTIQLYRRDTLKKADVHMWTYVYTQHLLHQPTTTGTTVPDNDGDPQLKFGLLHFLHFFKLTKKQTLTRKTVKSCCILFSTAGQQFQSILGSSQC